MNQKTIWIAVAALLVLVLGGLGLYNWVLGEPEAASAPIVAPTLAVTEAAAAGAAPTQPAPAAAQPTQAPADTAAPTQAAAATDAASSAALPGTGGVQVYKIMQAESQASFKIYELLNGQDKDVIGVTDQVAGEVAVDPADLDTVQLGEILINARTLATDDNRRNNAIRNRILNTDQYEYISFKPTRVDGLSGAGAPGQAYTFQVTGDLTIRDVTQPVTFQVSVNAESPQRLTGSATASIKRSDFNLNVPNVPFVANVADLIDLAITFVLVP